jgi:hypothetical protein
MPESRKEIVWIKRISFAIALGLVSYFVLMTVIIPVSRFKIILPEESTEIKKKTSKEISWKLSVADSVLERVVRLKSTEAYLLSRLEMTKTDSISLAVSLKDSSVSLVVQGVTIYSSKIQHFKISNALSKADPFILAQWLSKPFIVDTHFSSIPKTPVLYKKAPKDTIEAMNQLELDPLKDDLIPVHFTLKLDRELLLNFEQAADTVSSKHRLFRSYKREMRNIRRNSILKDLMRLSPAEIVPEIYIVIDKKAARVIYRALPEKALVAVQIQLD